MASHNREYGRTKRTVIIVVAVLLVVALAIASFFVWKATQDAANKNTSASNTEVPNSVNRDTFNDNDYQDWKTYTSTKSGYTIQYPSDWIIVPESDIDSLHIRNKEPINEGLQQYPEGYVNLRIYKTGDEEYSLVDMTAKGWYKILGTDTVSNGAVTYTPEDVTSFMLNGHEAKHLKSVVSLKEDEDVVLLDDDTLYTINIYPYGALDDETVEKIVASFTLTN